MTTLLMMVTRMGSVLFIFFHSSAFLVHIRHAGRQAVAETLVLAIDTHRTERECLPLQIS